MPAYYSIIQYVPDPVTDERINVGVAGYYEGRVETRFLVNWQRVRALCGKESVDLNRLEPLFRGIDEDRLRKMIGEWRNSIQFTSPGSSLKSLEDTIDEAAARFLVDPPLSVSSIRKHADVVATAKLQLSTDISILLGSQAAKSLVRPGMEFPGRFGVNRRFDLGVRNGRPLHAVQAISLQGPKSQEHRVESIAFLAEEVKGRLPLTVVVALPPLALENSSIYQNALKTFRAVGAEVVTEDDFVEVSERIAQAAAKHAS